MAWPFKCVPTEATEDMTQAAEVDAIAVQAVRGADKIEVGGSAGIGIATGHQQQQRCPQMLTSDDGMCERASEEVRDRRRSLGHRISEKAPLAQRAQSHCPVHTGHSHANGRGFVQRCSLKGVEESSMLSS